MDILDVINELTSGGTVTIIDQTAEQFIGGGLEISLGEGVSVMVADDETRCETALCASMSLELVREMYTVLGAYLALVDGE